MSISIKPLPCPFCGSYYIKLSKDGGGDERNGYNFSYRYKCQSCGASLSAESKHDKKGWCVDDDESVKLAALNKWNSRA